MPHGSYKSITDVTCDFPSLFLCRSFLSLLSIYLFLFVFPLPKLRAIMNASIFYLAPSARPYCSRLSSFPSRDEAVPIFSRAIFFFQLLSPVIGRLLMARDCLSRYPERRSRIRPTRACGLHPYPRPLPSAIVSATRASPS